MPEVARQRYLQRHLEVNLPPCPRSGRRWQNILVVPAYREPAAALRNLARIPTDSGATLVILVLNRPDSDPDETANTALRNAVAGLPASSAAQLRSLNAGTDLYLHDMERDSGALPAAQGVGLARKTGCDIAFKWMSEGAISSRWICSTDADAHLPADYMSRLAQVPAAAVAAVFPFWHRPGNDSACNVATALYELRLHHYVLGLEYARSPYAWHSLGSCLAVTADGYAQVRGFPRRAGGEDFYLLNKLAKIGPVARLQGTCLLLESRPSPRVPFGTGPAVSRIMAGAEPQASPLFYHPACFAALRALLETLPQLAAEQYRDDDAALVAMLQWRGLTPQLSSHCAATMQHMGLAAALAHCRRQGRTPDQFLRQFHQWFDGFRTLKFLHAIRAAGWPDQTLAALCDLHPAIWPADCNPGIDSQRRQLLRHWSWTVPPANSGWQSWNNRASW